MSLKYALYKNALSKKENCHRAVPQGVTTYTREDIIHEIAVPGGVTTVQAAAVLAALGEIERKILSRGDAINTGTYKIYPSIRGNFDGEDDRFDPSRHQVELKMKLGSEYKKIAESIEVQKVSPHRRAPRLYSFYDYKTQSENRVCSPGELGKIEGDLLKFNPDDGAQGVFFIQVGGLYRAEKYISNNPRELLFYIPEIPPGKECSLEVRATLFHNTKVTHGSLFGTLIVGV